MPHSVKGGYDLSLGIQEVLHYEPLRLPEKTAVAPPDSSGLRSLEQVYFTGNCGAVIDAFLRPAVQNLENLSPGSHRLLLRELERGLDNTDHPACEKLRRLLSRDRENTRLLETFQGLLISG